MKIAIIGAGIVGMSSAYYLQKQGHTVTVFDSLPEAGLETSFANAGLLTPSLCEPWNSPGIAWNLLKHLGSKKAPIRIKASRLPSLFLWGLKFIRYSSPNYFYKNFERNVLLANYSLQLFDELSSELNLDFHYNKAGTLKIFRDKRSFLQIKEAVDLAKLFNISSILLDAEETVAKEPALLPIKNQLLGAAFYPEDALGDAFLFTKNLASFLEKNQVNFFYNTQTKLIDRGKGVCALEYNQQQTEFDRIVLAAGCYSSKLIQDLGLRLPIQPLKGYSITVNCKNWGQMPHIPVIDHEHHTAITPLGDRIRVTGGAELTGFDKTIASNRIEHLKQLLWKMYPSSKESIDEHSILSWSGLRPTSVDGVPFITPTQYKNLYINSGHGHLGWTMSLGSGKVLADLISGIPSPLIIKEYSLERLD